MTSGLRLAVTAAVLAAAVAGLALLGADHGSAAPDGAAARRAGTFAFAPGTADADRARFLDAVASARPETRALLDLVDGQVTVSFGSDPSGALGRTTVRGQRDAVLIDMALVSRTLGPRGVRRVVLHELGHVVDFALLDEAQRARFDATVPQGYACPPESQVSACAPRAERFAETFAKWATGDLGVNLYAGYGVMPPTVPLDTWGAPLAALASS